METVIFLRFIGKRKGEEKARGHRPNVTLSKENEFTEESLKDFVLAWLGENYESFGDITMEVNKKTIQSDGVFRVTSHIKAQTIKIEADAPTVLFENEVVRAEQTSQNILLWFTGKPCEETRSYLKELGFKWNMSIAAWTLESFEKLTEEDFNQVIEVLTQARLV